MSVQGTIVLNNGQIVQGINYRMGTGVHPMVPGGTAAPPPFDGGTIHVQTPYGWQDILTSDIHSLTINSGLRI
jgi:hypothetical protein